MQEGGEREKTHPSHLPVTYEITGWENYDKRFFFRQSSWFCLSKEEKSGDVSIREKSAAVKKLSTPVPLFPFFLLFGAQCGVIASDTQLSPAHVFQLSFPFYLIFCVQEVAAVVVTAVTVTDRIRPGQLLARFRTNFAVQWEREREKKKKNDKQTSRLDSIKLSLNVFDDYTILYRWRNAQPRSNIGRIHPPIYLVLQYLSSFTPQCPKTKNNLQGGRRQ